MPDRNSVPGVIHAGMAISALGVLGALMFRISVSERDQVVIAEGMIMGFVGLLVMVLFSILALRRAQDGRY